MKPTIKYLSLGIVIAAPAVLAAERDYEVNLTPRECGYALPYYTRMLQSTTLPDAHRDNMQAIVDYCEQLENNPPSRDGYVPTPRPELPPSRETLPPSRDAYVPPARPQLPPSRDESFAPSTRPSFPASPPSRDARFAPQSRESLQTGTTSRSGSFAPEPRAALPVESSALSTDSSSNSANVAIATSYFNKVAEQVQDIIRNGNTVTRIELLQGQNKVIVSFKNTYNVERQMYVDTLAPLTMPTAELNAALKQSELQPYSNVVTLKP